MYRKFFASLNCKHLRKYIQQAVCWKDNFESINRTKLALSVYLGRRVLSFDGTLSIFNTFAYVFKCTTAAGILPRQ